jgi:hypothetical protein
MSVRLGEDDRLCRLVVIGVREDGVKKLLAVEDGYRESTDSWAAVLRDLRDRVLTTPKLMTGDGALGAWAALRVVFPRRSRTALLGAQDRQRPRRAAQAPAAPREGHPARDDGGPDPRRRRAAAPSLGETS